MDGGQPSILEVQVAFTVDPLLMSESRVDGAIDLAWFSPAAQQGIRRGHAEPHLTGLDLVPLRAGIDLDLQGLRGGAVLDRLFLDGGASGLRTLQESRGLLSLLGD